MRINKKIVSLIVSLGIMMGNINFSFADGGDVVTIGVDLTEEQKQIVFDYFDVKENEVMVIEVNNKEERKYLSGVASEAQLGKKTYSCSYVQPTEKGNGLNIKVSNLTYLNSSMLASVLVSLGVYDANVVAMSPVGAISGTGALAGVMKAYETAYNEELDEDKKEIASEELIITGDIGDEIGKDKAAGVINDIKTEIIKNGTSDTVQIAEVINNITNNYNVNLNEEQINRIISLMEKISQQDYDYKEMKSSLNYVSSLVEDNLEAIGERINKGFFVSIFDNTKKIINNLFSKDSDLGILSSTDDSLLGSNAIIDATDKMAINLPSEKEVEGFFTKVWNWVKRLFNENNSDNNIVETTVSEEVNDEHIDEIIIEEQVNDEDTEQEINKEVEKLQESSVIEENVNIEDNLDNENSK